MSTAIVAPALFVWRHALCLSQVELAQRAGISPDTIVRLEHGGRTHTAIVEKLNAALFAEEVENHQNCVPVRAEPPEHVDVTETPQAVAEQLGMPDEWLAEIRVSR